MKKSITVKISEPLRLKVSAPPVTLTLERNIKFFKRNPKILFINVLIVVLFSVIGKLFSVGPLVWLGLPLFWLLLSYFVISPMVAKIIRQEKETR